MARADVKERPICRIFKERIRQRRVTVGVVGLGIVGFITLRLFAACGFRVIGFDIDREVVACRQERLEPSAGCMLDSNPAVLADADVIVIAIRLAATSTELGQDAAFDYLTQILCALPDRLRLIILETTVMPGATHQFAEQLTGTLDGGEVLVAYCPERLSVGDELSSVIDAPRLVGGVTDEAAELACLFLQQANISAVRVSSPKIAELSKLLQR